ncbi:MAG TPA: serine protease [Flavipsychrobacter sp.]|nr:serine protease [Flavipsychrobacter sp.]
MPGTATEDIPQRTGKITEVNMMTEHSMMEVAERYIAGSLSQDELNTLKDKLAADLSFANEFGECVNMLRGLQSSSAQKRFTSMLKNIAAQEAKPATKARTITLRAFYVRTAGIAAGIAMLTSLTTYWAIQHSNKKIASQYSLLKRDLEKYQRSQNQLINNIKEQATAPQAEVRYTGTGFALSNDGYLVTNYHVTAGADSVYIQNREGRYFKAYTVGYDQQADIAILKVEDKMFRFGKGEVPYTFAPNKRKLGTKIYTLGFPQDEIVYNEGYISAINGYQGDSSQYRLEISAYPGQSGAPILDANGNVLAMITGKEEESDGTTFAVSSKALARLVQSLPKDANLRLPKSNKLNHLSLEQQIEKLEYYTCSIKVYKK